MFPSTKVQRWKVDSRGRCRRKSAFPSVAAETRFSGFEKSFQPLDSATKKQVLVLQSRHLGPNAAFEVAVENDDAAD